MQNRSIVFALSLLSALFFLTLQIACSPQTSDAPPENAIVRGRAVGKGRSNGLALGVVAIVSELQQGQALCSGTLIDEQTVLTAAHCVDQNPQRIVVVFGQKVQGTDPQMIREVSAFAQNPRWKKPTPRGRGDLALIHFEGALPEGYAPVSLIEKAAALPIGTAIKLLGYGVTNGASHAGAGVLRSTDSTIVDHASPTEVLVDGRQSSVCFGDSGGPAFAISNGVWKQWGVASSVTNSDCNEAAVHTDISSYETWIAKSAKSLAAKHQSSPDDTGPAPTVHHRRQPIELKVEDDETATAIESN